MPFQKTTISSIEIPPLPRYNTPPVLTDFDLASVLGIKTRTLWFLITQRAKLYSVFRIPKRTHGFRVIHNPDSRLKHVQRNLYTRFLLPVEMGECVCAYVPGRSVLDVPPRHLNKAVTVQIDIKDFFNSVTQGMVKDMFRDLLGYSQEVSSMLSGLVTVAQSGMHVTDHTRYFVPQGSPSSGAVCNLVVWQKVDQRILAFLQKQESTWDYDRYSDNIILSTVDGGDDEHVRQVVREIVDMYKDARFRINWKKLRYQRPSSRVNPPQVLGVSTDRLPNIPSTTYRKLRAVVHNVWIHGPDSQVERSGCKDVDHLLSSLRGKLNYWSRVNPRKIEPLVQKFEETLEMLKHPRGYPLRRRLIRGHDASW